MVMRRKCLQIFIVGILLGAMFLPFAYSEPVEAFSGSGAGTSDAPYVIHTIAQLQEMENDLDAYYRLSTDIDASTTSGWDGGDGFDPIDDFTGNFNGEGHTISHLYIDRFENYVGLFGEGTYGATIANVFLEDCNITGYSFVGALVGDLSCDGLASVVNCGSSGLVNGNDIVGGLIGNIGWGANYHIIGCFSDATVNCTENYAGGLIGRMLEGGGIYSCYATGDVTAGEGVVGGLVGGSGDGIFKQCYTTGTVTSTVGAFGWGYAGGFIGNLDDGSIANCYARGDVTATAQKRVGGFVGFNDASIDDSYSTGEPTGDVNSTGGFCGENNDIITSCFWDNQTSGIVTSDGGTGKNTTDMKTQATFTGWNFYSIWTIDGITNDGYPYFGYGDPPPIWEGENYTPIYLLAIPISSSEIALTWGMGVNTTETRIMGKTGGWPGTYNDPYATLVYEGDQTTVSHKGLDAGTTYYYRAWGVLGGGYSEDYAEDLATTLMGGGDNITVPEPPWWFQEPSCAAYENIPIFGLVESTAESYDMPCNTACLLITIFLLILISIIAFSITHNALTSGLVLAVGIVIASIAGLLPMWMLLVALLMVVGISFAWSRA